MADPKPVRKAEGRVPRQNDRMELGDLEISRMVARSELCPDCWTRVLRRSAGWRRTAERMPDPRPATKLFGSQCIALFGKYRSTASRLEGSSSLHVWPAASHEY